METRFIETFLAVADHGSLAGAARRLGITPATVAQRMRALESEIGAELLARAGKQVRPTTAGHAVLDAARRLVADARALRSLAQSDLETGELRLGAISTALTGLLPQALVRLRQHMPGVDIFVAPGTSSGLYAMLDRGEIDAVLLVRPPFELPKTRAWHMLRREAMMLLVPSDLAGGDPMQLLQSRPFIRYDRADWGGRLAQSWLDAHELQPREWLELDQLEAISVMVSSGLGISILPDWEGPWPRGVSVVSMPLPEPTIYREIGIVWNRHSSVEHLIAALISALDAHELP